MFEGVLYFILGFLASALLTLMVSPVIWNRAVTLTRRRIESSVPLTLNEIQADKDQLRAEFAMSTRRLEMSIEELREKASRQMIEINRKRDELARLSQESREKLRVVEELEARSGELRARLSEREEALEKTSRRLDEARAELDRRALEIERMRTNFDESQTDSDSRRIELATSQTRLDDALVRLQEKDETIRSLQAKLREAGAGAASSRKSDDDARLARLQKINAELEEKLQGRERELKEFRSTRQANEDMGGELTRQLMEERKRSTDLEAKLAAMALRTETLLNDASNENVKQAMAELRQEKTALRKDLAKAVAERDRLEKEAASYRGASQSDWESERKENALLRERINDLAAQVTAMTASLEGAGSPIAAILDAEEASRTARSAKTRASASGDTAPSAASLADRIRALQETARLGKAGS